MALQKHLTDSGSTTKVPIYLERLVRAEEIGESATAMPSCLGVYCRLQQALEKLPRTVAIAQTSPEVNLPRTAPSRTSIATAIQCDTACIGQLG